MVTVEKQPKHNFGDVVFWNGNLVQVVKIELAEGEFIYNGKLLESHLEAPISKVREVTKVLFAYERYRDGKILKFTREFGGNQYYRRATEWDEYKTIQEKLS